MKRRNLLTAAALGAVSLGLGVTLSQTAQAADVPGVAFV
ncbi:MAG: twin-arginine translocation signal domain-containing protein, partial [Paraburkholderia sp.]